MLSDDDVKAIEASATATKDPAALLRWIDELLRDRRERVEQVERARQRLKPFAYLRDVIDGECLMPTDRTTMDIIAAIEAAAQESRRETLAHVARAGRLTDEELRQI